MFVRLLKNIVYAVVSIVEVALTLRLALKILGANPANDFVSLMYSLTQPFVAPFAGIFNAAAVNRDQIVSVFEPATLVAILVYGIVGWSLAALIAFLPGSD
jgi:putative effector of murein hydrolase LrgA (UPF0299 family)